VDVAGRCREEGSAETPWKALAPYVQRIARSEDAYGKQRAVGGVNVRSYAQSSASDDNVRGSTNLACERQGMAAGNAREDTAKP
jgi:hypothetical protein